MLKPVKSILMVDDDPDDVFIIRDALSDISDEEYKITIANDPLVALKILERKSFDVILTDYRMGALTGIDLIKQIRSKGLSTPIILLTGVSQRELDDKALAAGASDYLSKADINGPLIERAIRYAIANARRQELFSSVLSNVKAAICVVDTVGTPQIWNPEFLAIAKLNSALLESHDAVAEFATQVSEAEQSSLVEKTKHEKKVTHLPDGRSVIMLHDISEHLSALRQRELAEEKAAHQAKTCSMTGLPNRLAFTEKLEETIRSGKNFSLLNIDLDKFKSYNDIYGHPFGDALLVKLSALFQNACAQGDYLARIGGDEFIAIQLHDGDDDRTEKLEDRIFAQLENNIMVDGRRLNMSVSIGVASFPKHAQTAQDLLSYSDIAMYRAKAKDGPRVEYYDSGLDEAVREQRRLTNDLQSAIREEQLDVFFQPQFDLSSGNLIGCEALARWIHPEDGPIRPDIFIKIAEDCGLIEDLGKLILRKACQLGREWKADIKVAVNISAVQVRHTDLVNDIQTILLETGFPARRLELEITETVLIEDFEHALHVLRGIKNLGVGLAMDDFGTGFSSLSSLISFPFDKLKIDRSFIMDMDKREQLKSVIRTCIGLGQNLNLRIVAEGVEQESHIDFLRSEGCDEMQGYFCGKPMPQALFMDFMMNYALDRGSAQDGVRTVEKVA
ncbi:bifunctional diguanylate cyclase/phosphodiesterase [Ahrensia sp. 13_GOM-1096m]|uniref:putative bifunctional diguanylate cyclase/phosphodiesterase n=1 Tax=Ahrensia sp. 13_GOM-1096m TaxID=1380380 RepID=UPI0006854FDE|nr:EAL domain-containing protein [Ahrensia sp. 13_GOM-1096m]